MVNTTKKTCKIDECDVHAKSRGMCARHYAQWRRTQPPAPVPVVYEKRCPICEEVKPSSEYYVHKTGFHAGKLQSYCKTCHHKKMRAQRFEKMSEKKASPPRTLIRDMDCAYEGCDRKAKTRHNGEGPYCSSHYTQVYLGQELRPVTRKDKSHIDDVVRKCTGCNRIKPEEMFYRRSNGACLTWCKSCSKKVSTFNVRLRGGAVEEALSIAENMPQPLRNKYVDIASSQLNKRGETVYE